MIPNRMKFFFAGPLLELVNPILPGRPHQRLAELVPESAASALEICAGTGYLSRIVAERHPGTKFHALDLSPEMLASGSRRAATAGLDRITFVRGDAGALPFEGGRFEVVMAAFGLHELPPDIRTRAVDEASRVLRPGGRLLVVDLDAPRKGRRAFSVYLRIAEKPPAREVLGDGLARLLIRCGFTVVRHLRIPKMPVPFQLIVAEAKAA